MHLSIARAVAFTQGINEAILADDQAKLQGLLFPLVANENELDRVDVLDLNGQQILGIYRPPGTRNVEDYRTVTGTDLSDWMFTRQVARWE